MTPWNFLVASLGTLACAAAAHAEYRASGNPGGILNAYASKLIRTVFITITILLWFAASLLHCTKS